MFGMNWSELFLIFIIALVVIGPKDIPKIMRAAGAMAARIRNTMQAMQRQWSFYVNMDVPVEKAKIERIGDEADVLEEKKK